MTEQEQRKIEAEFWRSVYVESIAIGKVTDEAKRIADAAVQEYNTRYGNRSQFRNDKKY